MTQEHPITPPPELLVQKWLCDDNYPCDYPTNATISIAAGRLRNVANQAARWGADQELEAYIKWIRERPCTWTVEQLRAARRPKPKSQAEEALEALNAAMIGGHIIATSTAAPTIRAALERLRELEKQADD